ncbi:F-actin-monooxygenase mical2b-like isoform X1 [Acipenser ruthenus]|uniref:F-actin-monooxygenase mical2b-like isoform X1 n=1 Tax=Acipenser ruthenus TaxID=7906 RepID=UPI002741F271|nr:F-actin-monooxygenase mical2b-like isoform X1 [Acipenser ruthenus]
MGNNDDEKNSQACQLFENFVQASTCKGTLQAFNILCRQLELDPQDYKSFYTALKSKVTFWKAKALWSKLDKRASHKEYQKGKACPGTRCLIIGGGPCGLRTAIELALLGAKVVVIEKRDTFSRNNVLHLWPYTIHDLRGLGAKKFYGKFCAGAIDHISIRQLQLMLVKVALIVGVEFHVNVEFVKLLEPPEDQENQGIGWRAEIRPMDHPVSDFEFDVVVGADGRRNTLEGFRRKEFRGKLAIAITANFINRNTTAEAKVEEISGVAFIFNQKFFLDLKEETGIDLENIVYYRDNTHYFVMTAKKQSLLDKGVIIHDYIDTEMLLSSENVNQEALLSYAREAADFGTNYQLPSLDFAINHYGQPDVAMFDFTSMHASENAALIRERHGHQLLVALVGDSLLEPFWPMGTGCARGFLAAFDTVWMVRSWTQGRAPLEVLAERESIYRLLPQTTPENITKNFDQYTIDPVTRYPNLNCTCVRPLQVRHLYITGELQLCTLERASSIRRSVNLSRRESEIRPNRLLTWCQKQTESYKNVHVSDLTTSWRSGLALCALIHHFRPDLLDFDCLNEEDVAENNQLAFDMVEREFGIPPVTTGKEMAADSEPDKLSMVMYLSKFYELFRGTPLPAAGNLRREIGESNEVSSAKSANPLYNFLNLTLPRKRTPKDDKKVEENDTTSKRRRKGFNHLEEASNFSSQSPGSEGGEAKDGGNQNKVKSMASQLLAKFEENAPSSSLRRKTGSNATKPPRPPSLDMSESPRFTKPKDQNPIPSIPPKRQFQSPASAQYVVNRTRQALHCAEYIPRKPKQADKTDTQAESTGHSASSRSTVLAVSGMLQRLQRLEDQINQTSLPAPSSPPPEPKIVLARPSPDSCVASSFPSHATAPSEPAPQRRSQSLSAREFHKKNIKEKAAHLCSLFGYMAFQPQTAQPALSSPSPGPKAVSTCPSLDSSAAASLKSHVKPPPPKPAPQDLDKLSYRQEKTLEQLKNGNLCIANVTSHVIFHNHHFENKETNHTEPIHASSGQRTVGKVSSVIGSMAEVLVTLYENDHRPKARSTSPVPANTSGQGGRYWKPGLGSLRKEFPQTLGGSDSCHFCTKRVYVMERLSAEGRFFHRECFRCDSCNTILRMGIYAFDTEEGKFYCKTHFAQCKTNNRHRKQRTELQKEDTGLSKQEEAWSSPDSANAYSAAITLEDSPPAQTSVRAIPEEDMTDHNLLAVHVLVTSDANDQCSDTESDPCSSSLNSAGAEIPDFNSFTPKPVTDSSEGHFRRQDCDLREENSKPDDAMQLSSKLQSSQPSPFDRHNRWRRKIQTTLPLIMYKRSYQHSGGDTHSVPEELSRSQKLSEQSSSEHLQRHSESCSPIETSTDKTTPSPIADRETYTPFTDTKKGGAESLFPSPYSTDTTRISVTCHDEGKNADVYKETKQLIRKRLTLSPKEKAKLLDWELSAPEDTARQRNKGDNSNSRASDHVGSSTSAAKVPSTVDSGRVVELPKVPSSSNDNDSEDSQSPLQFLANAFRKSFRGSSSTSSSNIRRTEKAAPRTRPLSEGSFFDFSAVFGKPVDVLTSNEPPQASSHLPASEIAAAGQPVIKVTPCSGISTEGPLQGPSRNTRRARVEAHDTMEDDMPRLLEKASLIEKPSSSSSDDVSFLSRRKPGFFSSLRIKKPEQTKNGQQGSEDVSGKIDIWRLLTSFRKKGSEKETKETPMSALPADSLSNATPSYVLSAAKKPGPSQLPVGSFINHQDDSSSSEDPEEKPTSKLKATTSFRRKKKQEKVAQHQARQEELKRLHRAQVIQRQLQEVEERQRALEEQGVKLEKALRGESDCSPKDETHLLHSWFKLVLEKNKLVRYESELMIFAQDLELEDCQSRLQQRLHERMAFDDSQKSQQERAEEQQVLEKMLGVVERRNKLVALLEEQRLREKAEDKDLECCAIQRVPLSLDLNPPM